MNMSDNPGDVVMESIERLRRRFGGTRTRATVVVLVLGAAALWVLFTGLYTVAIDEVAVIQRFGKYVRQAPPGLRFKLPDGIEHRTNVKVQHVFKEEFGMRTEMAGKKTLYAAEDQYLSESLMLTGDLNCALVPWIVQFRVSDPVKFLFRVRNVQATLRDLSEAIMRQVVGDRSINEVLSKRLEIADEAKAGLQELLNEAETGITIVNVELKNTTVPQTVQPSFNEVNQAEQEKERMINEARADYNKAIPAARGNAEKMLRQAEGYALDRINTAKGDSARYIALYNEYNRARDVTRRRMYLETIQDVLPKLGSKYFVDSDHKGLLPLLNVGGKGGAR